MAKVKLIIYDVLGREVVTLVNEKQNRGYYEVEWNTSNQPSGVYLYQLSATNATKTFVKVKKMLLLK